MTILTFKLTLQEPVLVTAPGGDPNTDESQAYIPGSAIRGALVAQYLQRNGKDNLFSQLFLDGSTRFLNAYLEDQGTRLLPTPEHWQREKDPASGEDKDKRRVYDLSVHPLKVTTAVGGPFMAMDGDLVRTKRPSYQVAVHNARNREMGRAVKDDDRSALFRYHALAEGQNFIGRIVIEDALMEKIRPLLNSTVLLGGSNTAGYGLTIIEEIPDSTTRELSLPYIDIAAGEKFYVYLTSDAILRHPTTGQPGSHLQEVLEKALGCNLEVDKRYGRIGWVGGFNTYWGLPLPQTWAMLKGTVWLVSSNKPISTQKIEELEQAGIGDRRAEGFGCLLLIPQTQWTAERYVPHPEPRTGKKERETLDFKTLATKEQELLNYMNKRIARQELDRHLAVAVQNVNTASMRLSNSQLSRIRLKVRQDRLSFSAFIRYLDGTVQRKSADDQFRKSRVQVNGQTHNFREWLLTLAKQPGNVWQVLKLEEYGWKEANGWQRPLLGKEPYTSTSDLAIEYTIRLVDAVCEQAQKRRIP